jgi:hypothetical protein
MNYDLRQPFDRDSAGRDNGAASPESGSTDHYGSGDAALEG